MKKIVPAANPEAYVAARTGWQLATTRKLRKAVLASSTKLVETIKWGNIVFLCNGPVLVIRAEAHRVLFCFFRGKRLQDIEARLRPSGKYELANIELHEGDSISPAVVRRLTTQAIKLNRTLGDPTKGK
jgi:hypothetical protein